MPAHFPPWTLAPFVLLVLAIAVLPVASPRAWARPAVQVGVALAAALPVVGHALWAGAGNALAHTAREYGSFIVTIAALYVVSGGVRLTGDLVATPRTNVAFVALGALLASLVGTTGASVLLIRPLLATNRQREHKAHLVPFFLVAVANAGGMLTPLGDPPLLIGYVQGVPFGWTLGLWPFWLLYVGVAVALLWVVDARAWARESAAARERDRAEREPLAIAGRGNVVALAAIVAASLLPSPAREGVLVALALVSWRVTPRALHAANELTLGPLVEVAVLFAALFATLVPVGATLARAAPTLPLHHAWQFFWSVGSLSAVLDNAPAYAAFAALARGLGAGHAPLVAGVREPLLIAISVGSVVMGATTYIGNAPNLIVKAIAERARHPMPSFARYALFAFAVMLPAHLVTTLALVLMDR